MSITSLPARIFHTRITIYRPNLLKSDVGDFTRISEDLLFEEVPAVVQPTSSEFSYEVNGTEHFQTHVAFINYSHNSQNVIVQQGDIVIDKNSGLKHRIIGFNHHYAANVAINGAVQHVELILENISSQDQLKLSSGSVAAKISIQE